MLLWARGLERSGFVNLSTYEGVGAKRYTLLPRLVVGGRGLVTIWNDGGAYLSFWRSVFEKRAPDFIERIEDLTGTPVGQGNTARNISDDLLEALTDAYAEAAN